MINTEALKIISIIAYHKGCKDTNQLHLELAQRCIAESEKALAKIEARNKKEG